MLTKNIEKKEITDVKVGGLCETCIHASDCIYCKSHAGTIISCEEFETDQPKKVLPKVRIKPIKPVQAEESLDKGKKFQGLCVNCENRFTCKNCNQEGGIWHCEEYR